MEQTIFFRDAMNYCDNLRMASAAIEGFQKSASHTFNYNIYISTKGPGSVEVTTNNLPNLCKYMPEGSCVNVDFSSPSSLSPFTLSAPNNNGNDFMFLLRNVPANEKISYKC